MTQHPATLYRALLEAKLRRAIERENNATSLRDVEAFRQIRIWIRQELEALGEEAA